METAMHKWFELLRGGPNAPDPEHPGTEAERSTSAAIRQLERRAGVDVVEQGAASERLSIALGRTLAGDRAAAVVAPGALPELHGALRAATERLAPVLVHAVRTAGTSWGSGPDAVLGTGGFVAASRSAAHAVNLTLFARALAERALVPAVLLHEQMPKPEPVVEPADATLRELLGAADGDLASPTEAQRALFGADRRRLVRWFDPDHPAAVGGGRDGVAAAAAELGRHLFVADSVDEIAAQVAAEQLKLTGRSIAALDTWGLDGADVVVVGWGEPAAISEMVAERLRGERGPKVGVISLTFLRPFPAAELARLLAGKRAIAVLEPTADPLAGLPPLARDVAAAAPAVADRLMPVSCSLATHAKQVAAMMRVLMGKTRPPRLALDVPAPAAQTGFPRRDALLGGLRAQYDRLDAELLPAPETPALALPSQVPPVLARIAGDRRAPDSLPRFWGEVVQPTLGGSPPSPDPVAAAGVVPAGATALQPGPDHADAPLPALDSAACTACGDCWTACPQGAIGAVLPGAQALLTEASHLAGTAGKPADSLRRAYKHAAGRMISLSGDGAVDADVLERTWAWLSGKVSIPDDDYDAWKDAWSATAAQVTALAPAVATAVPGEATELLLWSVDAAACDGCGACVSSCDEEALTAPERTPDLVAAASARRAAWDALPDTPGEALSRASDGIGSMAATLLARGPADAQLPGDPAGAPAGVRLGLRLLTAVTEAHGQRRLAERLGQLGAAGAAVEDRIRTVVTNSVVGADAAKLAEAVARSGQVRVPLGELVGHLEELDVPLALDRKDLLSAARTSTAVSNAVERLKTGADGLGRARFAVLATRSGPAAPLLRHPLHPWFAPAAVVDESDAAATALGLARALTAEHTALVRLARRAELLARPPSDLPARLDAIARLGWSDLEPADRADCPPLLLIATRDGHLPALLDLQASDLPIVVVVLDHEAGGPGSAVVLEALTRTGASVVSASVGDPDHLAASLTAALSLGAPAVLHVHAPDAEPSELRDAARAAVEAGEHVLLRYTPDDGLDLSGNPDPATALRGPLVDRLQDRLVADAAAEQAAAVQAKEAEHAAALADAAAGARAEHVRVLTDRLMELAGYGAAGGG